MPLIDVVRPTKERILVALLIPVILLAIMIAINPAYQRMLSANEPLVLVVGIGIGILAGAVLYYPMACGLIYLLAIFQRPGTGHKAKGKAKAEGKRKEARHASRKELAFAIALIAVFNPLTVSLISSGISYANNYVINRSCGVEIAGFQELSPARDAGMGLGEVITSADGTPVSTLASFFDMMKVKNVGEAVMLTTSRTDYVIKLVADPDTGKPVLGIFVREVYCPRSLPPEALPPSLKNVSMEAFYQCKQSCVHTMDAGDQMENGPCLLDRIPSDPDWSCDIAHMPRQEVDNNPDNQCQAYRSGNTTHFIELSTECRLIRAE